MGFAKQKRSQKVAMVLSCPKCNSKAVKRNGYTRHGKQNHRCLDCGRQFSLEAEEDMLMNEKKEFAEVSFNMTSSERR